ncbi:MAG: lactate dehydrogenase [Bacteroidota bacterium]|uniref:Lactate dehydrogenase n=1 Tax=Pedobacter cryotolerans TaxID=2571270 RepID=A0A4U1BXN4_9SPHI|nr:lactate dehydrogenase [Pedobacter cryotolerans]TKB97137.1 lactate dehydrogenase [Pedobacter cryotolerans]
MKAIAYNINPKEKEWLILANYKKHEITIIANSLTLDTLNFAAGKEALIVFNQDPLNADIVAGLKALGIKYIATSSFDYSHIDLFAAKAAGLKIANIPFKDGGNLENMHQVIKNLDNWAAGKCVGDACCCQNSCAVKSIIDQNHEH